MNPARLSDCRVQPVTWPLRRPFVTALGQKSVTANVLVSLALRGGTRGWGEASSSLAMPRQTGPGLAAALRRLGRMFRGRDARDIETIVRQAWRAEPGWPTAVAAFEAALWDALAQSEGVPLWSLWGGAERAIETVLSISAVDPAEVGRRARSAARRGWRRLKLKLNGGQPPEQDRDRLRAARRAAPRAKLLIDPNQSYTPARLEELLARAASDGIAPELIEEPFRKGDWASLADARRRRLGPILLDESVQNASDARRSRGLAAGVNIKLAKSGLLGGREILEALDRRAVLMVGCMAESRVGLSAAVHFALGLGGFDHADLDSDLILKATGVRGGYVRRGPWVSLPPRPRPGLGLSVPDH